VPEVSIIPVPVDASRFRPPSSSEKAAADRDLNIDSESIALFVGHLQERKGVDLLIRAFRQVLDAGLDAHLVIVGGPVEAEDARYVESLEVIVRESGRNEHVVFVGPQDDVTQYLFAVDVFCLPSHREGMPNVLLEAMACGLTCVAPASAGGDELLFGSAGVIPDSNSSTDLAGALIDVLVDPELRRTLGKSAAARAGGTSAGTDRRCLRAPLVGRRGRGSGRLKLRSEADPAMVTRAVVMRETGVPFTAVITPGSVVADLIAELVSIMSKPLQFDAACARILRSESVRHYRPC
jgi:hypothetical protein